MDELIVEHVRRVMADPFAGHTNVWREQHDKTTSHNIESYLKALQAPAFMALQGLSPPDASIPPQLARAVERISKARGPLREIKQTVSAQVTREYQLGFAYLESLGRGTELLEFCAAQGFAADWVVARNFYYARNIIGLHRMVSAEQPTILEFGAGSGALPIILWRLGIPKRYIIIDLPEVLAYSATQVRKWLPTCSIAFEPNAQVDFIFLRPDQTDAVSEPVHIAVNFVSFAEMEKRWVDQYFDMVYRVTPPGALFYNANRTHQGLRQSDGSHFYSHPLLYPYHADDDVVIWDVDPLQDHSRSWVNARPANPAYARASRVHGAGARKLMPATSFDAHPLESLIQAAPGWSPWTPK